MQLVIHQLVLMLEPLYKLKQLLTFFLAFLLLVFCERFYHLLELNPHHTLDLIIVDGWLKFLLAVRMMPQVVSVFKEVDLKIFVVLRSLPSDSIRL